MKKGSQTKNAIAHIALADAARLAPARAALPAIAMPKPTPKNVATKANEAVKHKPSHGRQGLWLAPMRNGPNIRVYGGNW